MSSEGKRWTLVPGGVDGPATFRGGDPEVEVEVAPVSEVERLREQLLKAGWYAGQIADTRTRVPLHIRGLAERIQALADDEDAA